MTITETVVHPILVRAFCGCGEELKVIYRDHKKISEGAGTYAIQNRYHYKCKCGNITVSEEQYPRIDYDIKYSDNTGERIKL